MVAMVITAYAYFSVEVSSQNNMIQAAHFDVEINVSSEIDGIVVSETVTHQSADVYLVKLKADTVYAVEVRTKGTVNTGFVVVSAGGYQYHTEQLLNEKNSIIFFLRPTVDMEVKLMPHWGTSSHYEKFLMGANDAFYLQDDPNGLSVKELAVYVPPADR